MPSKDVVKLFCFQRAATTYYYPHSSSPFHRRRWKPTILRKIKQSILSYQSTKKCTDETDSIVVQLRARSRGLEASSVVVMGGGGNGQGRTRVSLHVYQRHGCSHWQESRSRKISRRNDFLFSRSLEKIKFSFLFLFSIFKNFRNSISLLDLWDF